MFGSKLKKLQKKSKNAVNIDDLLKIPTPSIMNTLPFQIPRAIWNTPHAIKTLFCEYLDYRNQLKEEKERYFLLKIIDNFSKFLVHFIKTIVFLLFSEEEEVEEQRLLEEEIAREKEARKEGLRNRKPVFTVKEKTDEELKGYSQLKMEQNKGSGPKAAVSKVNHHNNFQRTLNSHLFIYSVNIMISGNRFERRPLDG